MALFSIRAFDKLVSVVAVFAALALTGFTAALGA